MDYKEQLKAVSELKNHENASRDDVIRLLCELIPEFKLQSGAARPLVNAITSGSSDDSDESVEIEKPR